MSTRWVHNNNVNGVVAYRPDFKERGVSKKERRRRKAAFIAAIDSVDISADEAMKALKDEMTVKKETEDGDPSSQETGAAGV